MLVSPSSSQPTKEDAMSSLSDRALRRPDHISDISLSQWIMIFSHKVAITESRSILFSATITHHHSEVQLLVSKIITGELEQGEEVRVHHGDIIWTNFPQYKTDMMLLVF